MHIGLARMLLPKQNFRRRKPHPRGNPIADHVVNSTPPHHPFFVHIRLECPLYKCSTTALPPPQTSERNWGTDCPSRECHQRQIASDIPNHEDAKPHFLRKAIPVAC